MASLGVYTTVYETDLKAGWYLFVVEREKPPPVELRFEPIEPPLR